MPCKKRNPTPKDFKTAANLNPGWNKLLMDISSNQNGLGFFLAINKKRDLIFRTGTDSQWPRKWCQIAENTYINKEVDPEKSFYKKSVLHLASPKHVLRRAFLYWDITGIPQDLADQLKCEIILHPAWIKGKGTVWITETTSPWQKETISYNRQPSRGDIIGNKVNVRDKIWRFSSDALDKLVAKWIKHPEKNNGITVDTDISFHCGFYGGNATNDKTSQAAIMKFRIMDKKDNEFKRNKDK
jgi:hypothetical protein